MAPKTPAAGDFTGPALDRWGQFCFDRESKPFEIQTTRRILDTMPGAPIPNDTRPSLMHGVFGAACEALCIANLRHKSALLTLKVPDGLDLAGVVQKAVAANWDQGGAAANRDRSRQNWRWTLQPQIGSANRSPEVMLERAIARACADTNRSDWANQIPVASGLIAGASDGRRAIDLAQRVGQGAYQLIEMKIASDTPLYAAVELLGYASIWLLARKYPPSPAPELLLAERIELRVLAPTAFYQRFDLAALERALDASVQTLGGQEGVILSFGFDVLPETLNPAFLPSGAEVLAELANRGPLHGTV